MPRTLRVSLDFRLAGAIFHMIIVVVHAVLEELLVGQHQELVDRAMEALGEGGKKGLCLLLPLITYTVLRLVLELDGQATYHIRVHRGSLQVLD